jgi:hypothetical protein
LSIPFLFDENPDVASVGSGDASVGRGLESAFQTAKQKQVGAIMTTAGRNFFAARKRIVELAGKHSVAGYLLPEGVCRCGRSHVLWG